MRSETRGGPLNEVVRNRGYTVYVFHTQRHIRPHQNNFMDDGFSAEKN